MICAQFSVRKAKVSLIRKNCQHSRAENSAQISTFKACVIKQNKKSKRATTGLENFSTGY
jgi:hypothetical protein